jgi:hypothetical protein
VTEGVLKADVATALSEILTVGLPGVSAWKRAAAVLQELGAKTARLALDADASTKRAVGEALARLADDLRSRDFVIELNCGTRPMARELMICWQPASNLTYWSRPRHRLLSSG